MNETIINSNDVLAMGVNIASPEMIRSWSFGEVVNPETMNYKKLRPEPGGLFCERIFGPVKDLECSCGEYKGEINRGHICEICGVEVTDSSVRRERMGHIELATPIAHIWYGSRNPSFIAIMLDLSRSEYDSIAYCEKYIVTKVNNVEIEKEIDKYEDIIAHYESQPEDNNTARNQEFIEITKKIIDVLKGLHEKSTLTFETNKVLKEYAPNCFESGTGGDAIRRLLSEIDVDKTYDELSSEIIEMKESATKQKLVEKLKIVSAFKSSGNRPEWMVLTVIPVIPPDIRPMLQLDGGKFAASDINEFYRKIIMRNNRLKALLKIEAPEAIINNEKRMLQRAVDNLFDNSENNRKAALKKLPPMKSLSDTLKGKKGRFRMNLLGKRVDYSGRSVIIVGPKLRLYQCGLPKIMALDLYKPFVISELISMGAARTVKGAKKIISGHGPEVWQALAEVVKTRPVMLNRAPSLHRLSIQAFEPVLIEESAIQLHPLVCSAFNADFDGDQMAVHLPVSFEAAQEARDLMLASKNLLKPSDGEPIISPSKDMVLGIFCLTMEMQGEHKNDGIAFYDYDDVKYSFDIGEVELYTRIRFRCETWYDKNDKRLDKPEVRFINTTVGRVFFNYILDERMMFRNIQFGKGGIKDIITDTFAICGQDATAILADKIKDIGFEYSMKSGVTIAVSDITVPPEREIYIEASEKKEKDLKKANTRGLLSDDELEEKTVEIWKTTTGDIGDAIKKHMDPEGNMAIMANSGATKGGFGPISQLAGMRGLMADPSGRVITLPIKSNIKMGLSAIEYFIATHGARKGLADTALRTADAGYMTRRLVDVTQDIIINAEDCGTMEGVIVDRNVEIAKEKFSERLFSRILAEDVVDPETGKTLYKRGQLIHNKEAKIIENSKVQTVKVRSPMTCELKHGICAQCYGLDLARNEMVKIGEAVGTMAAQSIGEPGTQLTLRTFHSGGVAGAAGDITSGLPRVEELFEARIPKVEAVLSEQEGIAEIHEDANIRMIVVKADNDKGNILARYKVGPKQAILINDGQSVKVGDTLTSGALNLYKLLELKGRVECFLYILREAQNVYRPQGQSINDKHFEMIIRKMLQFVRITDPGDTDYTIGSLESYIEVNIVNRELANQGKKPALYKDVLLGMSKASLSIDSWLSAASFQHTVDVLALSGVRGDIDYLRGLKENIIIGKLIPAGTGFDSSHVES